LFGPSSEYLGPTICRRQGVRPLHRKIREVVDGHEPALRLDLLGDCLGNLALVDNIGPPFGDQFEAVGQFRQTHLLSDAGGRPVDQERIAGVVVGKQVLGVLPPRGHHLRDGVALAGVPDCGVEHRRQRPSAEPLDGRLPAPCRSGNRDRVRAVVGHDDTLAGPVTTVRGLALGDGLADALAGRALGCAAARPHRADLAVCGPVTGKDIATEAGTRRFDDVQCRRGRNRRVEGVAPVTEDGRPRLGGEWLARRNNTAGRVDGRPARVEAIEVRVHTTCWTPRDKTAGAHSQGRA